jgi:hypothetical protein
MISCVVFEISPELKRHLRQYSAADQTCHDIIESLITDKEKGIDELHAHTEMVSDWITEDWFKGQNLRNFLDHDDTFELKYPDCCDDWLIKTFVDKILQVYRLTTFG